MDMRLYGIAYAGLATNGVNFILMIVLFWLDSEMYEARVAPDRRIFKDLKSFLALQIPSTINLFIDFWAWE